MEYDEDLHNALERIGFKDVKSIKCNSNVVGNRIKQVCKILLRNGEETNIENNMELD